MTMLNFESNGVKKAHGKNMVFHNTHRNMYTHEHAVALIFLTPQNICVYVCDGNKIKMLTL